MNIELATKYKLSHSDRIVVFENRLHSGNLMLYRPALHGNGTALCLTRRALKDKFPMPTVPLTAVLPNHRVFLPDPVQITLPSPGESLKMLKDEVLNLQNQRETK